MAAPLAPAGLIPCSGQRIHTNVNNAFSWQSDASQAAYYIEYSLNVAGATVSNTGWQVETVSSHTFVADTFTNTFQYKWRVKIRNSIGQESVFSDWVTFRAGNEQDLSVTFPAADYAVLSSLPTYQHVLNSPQGYDQKSYRYQVYTGATWGDIDALTAAQQEAETWDGLELYGGSLVWDSGVVESESTSVEQPPDYFIPGTYWYKVRVTVVDVSGNSYSSDLRTFYVLLDSIPKTPTITVESDPDNGRNVVTISNPIPDAGQVEADYNRLYRKRLDGSWELVHDNINPPKQELVGWEEEIAQSWGGDYDDSVNLNQSVAQKFTATRDCDGVSVLRVSVLSRGYYFQKIDTKWTFFSDNGDSSWSKPNDPVSNPVIIPALEWPSSGWVNIEITLNEPMVEGQAYWIVGQGASSPGGVYWGSSESNPYIGGHQCTSNDNGVSWIVQQDWDSSFKIETPILEFVPGGIGYDTTCRSGIEEEYSASAVGTNGIEGGKSTSAKATCELNSYWFTNLTTSATVKLHSEPRWGQMQSERSRAEYSPIDEQYITVLYGPQRFYRGSFQALLFKPTDGTLWRDYMQTIADVLDSDSGDTVLMRSPFGDMLKLNIYNLQFEQNDRMDETRWIRFDMVEVVEAVPVGSFTYDTPPTPLNGFWIVDPDTGLGMRLNANPQWGAIATERDRAEMIGLNVEMPTASYGSKKAKRSGFAGLVLPPSNGSLAQEVMRLRELIDGMNKKPLLFRTISRDMVLVDVYGFTFELYDRTSQARKVSFEFVEIGGM